MIEKTLVLTASVVTFMVAQAATTYTVASGESLTLDASSNNKAGNQITLNDGATLVAPVPVGGDGYTIKARISVAGAARLDLASTPESAYYLRIVGGLVASNDTCSLTVGGGLTQVFFGAQAGDGIINNSTAAVDGNGVHYPIINLKNLNFDATPNGTFTFRGTSASTVVQVPTTCRIRFVDGGLATLALKGEDVFAQLGQTPPYSPTNFNAVVLDKSAIPAGALVKVPAGRTMAVKPCKFNGWNWSGEEQEVCFNVELEDEDSILLFRTVNSGWTRFVGDITGAGKVYVRGETGNASGSRVMFNGDIACSGGLELSDKGEVRYGPDASWRTKASHWFDAADTNSYVMFTAEPPAGRTTQVGDAESGYFDTIVGWKDTVKGTNDVFCYNTRLWANGRQPKENYVVQVLPYIVSKGLNGLNYICFGKAGGQCTEGWGSDTSTSTVHSRRLPFWRGEADGSNLAAGAAANFQCKYAIMVFGSQQGGGWALLGTPNSAANRLTREKTLNDPWLGVNASKYDMIVDGAAVDDPGTDKPNGGWQIVSLDMTRNSTTINALGAQSADGPNATAAGGQNYAEVIFFDEKPTDSERLACERYLAKKWGLTNSYTGGIVNEYRLNSADTNTTVRVVGDVTLAGVYEGAITVDDRSSVSFTREMPPTEADIPATGRVGWFDPDFEPTCMMRTNNVNRPLELDGVLCRTADGVDTTRGWMGGARGSDVQNRCPWIDESSHNGGPVRHWIDFRDIYDKTYDDSEKIMGNMLRYRTVAYSESAMKSTASTTFNIQQAFMVLDTSAGGGTPLLDKSNASGVVKKRLGTNRPGDTYSSSIHVNTNDRKTEGVFLGGKAWLNKAQVDPYTHGFTGKPEILTLETTGDFPVGFLAYYGERDGYRDGNYEIMGETIFYSAPLSDEARAKVQGYLMYKWLGKIDGSVYSDSSKAKLSGAAGTVTAANFDDESLPDLSSFAGTLAITNDLAFTVGETKTCGYGVALPDGGTVSIEVPDGTANGTYSLLTASSIAGSENVIFVLSGADVDKYKFKVTCSGDTLSVKLRRVAGFLLSIH